MLNKKQYFLILIALVLIATLFLFVFNPKKIQETQEMQKKLETQKMNADNAINTTRESQEIECAKEGKTIGAQGMPKVCCKGLVPVGGWEAGYQGDCSVPPPPTGLSICSNCGDDICNLKTGENKCNCPSDCE
jgi:hypothetical protein